MTDEDKADTLFTALRRALDDLDDVHDALRRMTARAMEFEQALVDAGIDVPEVRDVGF